MTDVTSNPVVDPTGSITDAIHAVNNGAQVPAGIGIVAVDAANATLPVADGTTAGAPLPAAASILNGGAPWALLLGIAVVSLYFKMWSIK